jgi:endonuclease
MAKTMYEKPVRSLLRDMLQGFGIMPGQIITTGRVLSWFTTNFPKLQHSGVKANLVLLSTNDKNRLHHPVKPEDDLLFKVAPGQFRLYEPGKDPAPIHELVEGDVAIEEEQTGSDDSEDGAAQVGSTEFLLERDLQLYLAKNLDKIEPGLKLYQGEVSTGLEFDAGGRRIDILAVDRNGAFVVLELKVSKGYDRVVGQLLRYVNWIRQNLAENQQKVRGMIVCRMMSEDLRLACASIEDVELFEYQLSVAVSKVPALELEGVGLDV